MKLVRDNTEAALAGRDPRIVFEKGDPALRVRLLLSKMLEEVGEYMLAEDREQKLKELGDMQEIIWAWAFNDGISEMEVAMQAASKRTARGDFKNLSIMKVQTSDERPKVVAKPDPVNTYERSYWGGAGYSG